MSGEEIERDGSEDELDELASQLRDGELDEAGKEQLRELIREDGDCRDRFLRHLYLEALLKEEAESGGMGIEAAPERPAAGEPAKRRFPMAKPAIAATIAAAAVIGGLLSGWPGKGGAVVTLEAYQGAVHVEGADGKALPLEIGIEFGEGATIKTLGMRSSATLAYDDGTRVMVTGGVMETGDAVAILSAVNGRKQIDVKNGLIFASVAKQRRGNPMVMATPKAKAEVLGTRFALEARSDLTGLNVEEGTVRLSRLLDGESLDVHAGERVVARDQAALVAESAALGETWDDDFEEGLGDWTRGVPEKENLPPGSKGAIRSEAMTWGDQTFYQVGCMRWTDGFFTIREDSHLHITHRLEDPRWFNVFMLTRYFDEEGRPQIAQYKLDPLILTYPAREPQWRTATVPISNFKRKLADFTYGEEPPGLNEAPSMIWIGLPDEDRGLVIDRIWVTRGGPGEMIVKDLE